MEGKLLPGLDCIVLARTSPPVSIHYMKYLEHIASGHHECMSVLSSDWRPRLKAFILLLLLSLLLLLLLLFYLFIIIIIINIFV